MSRYIAKFTTQSGRSGWGIWDAQGTDCFGEAAGTFLDTPGELTKDEAQALAAQLSA